MAKTEEAWQCNTCSVDLVDRGAVLEHLKTVHGMTGDNPQGNRRMLSHMDGRDWYGGSNSWVFADKDGKPVELIETYRSERSKDDMMRFA